MWRRNDNRAVRALYGRLKAMPIPATLGQMLMEDIALRFPNRMAAPALSRRPVLVVVALVLLVGLAVTTSMAMVRWSRASAIRTQGVAALDSPQGAPAGMSAAVANAAPEGHMPSKAEIPADCPPDLRSLLERLSSPDALERAQAAKDLGKHPEWAQVSVPFLTKLVGDDTQVVLPEPMESSMSPSRTSPGAVAAASLGDLGMVALPAIVSLMRDRDPVARRHVARVPGAMAVILYPGLAAPLPPTNHPLPGPLPASEVRARAVALSRAIPDVAALLHDADPETRALAAQSLGFMASRKLWVSVPEDEREAWARRETAVPAIVPLLQDGTPRVQQFAGLALGEIGGRQAVDALIPALKDPDPLARGGAAWGLGYAGDTRAVEPLMPLVQDEDDYPARAAAASLTTLKDRRATKAFVEALSDPSRHTRGRALGALAEFADPDTLQPLLQFLRTSDSEDEELTQAGRAIGSIGSGTAVEPLAALLRTERPGRRDAAMLALGMIGDQMAVSHLIRAVAGEGAEARTAAARALRRVRNRAAVEAAAGALLGSAAPDERLPARARGRAIAAISEAFRIEQSDRWRAPLAAALAASGDPTALALLENSLRTLHADYRETREIIENAVK